MKTKYAPGTKPNLAGTGDTSRSMPKVTLPSPGPLPTAADNRSYMYETPNAQVVTPKETDGLPMFSPASGFEDTGVSHTGDAGGAA